MEVMPKTDLDLSVIVLNWNAAPDTIRCIRSVASWGHPRAAIWAVDNDSSDGSAEAISRACPDARLIRNPANLGFAGGNNVALDQALASHSTPILLLNNDAFISRDDVSRLLETLAADNHIGFVGPLLFDADEGARLLSAGGRNPVLHHHSHIQELPIGDPIQRVEYVPGTVIIARAEVFRRVGMFDPDYFFTMEVADLCMRARQQGYLSAIDTRARATHALDRSSAFRETLYPYYIIRNRFLFIRKFYGKRGYPLFGVWASYSLALSLKVQLNGQSAMARAVRLGLRDGLQGRFGGQNERVMSACAASGDKTGQRQ
jgi:GT2 family glycosyltransferase